MSDRRHDALFWRKLAHWGASKGPEWWVRYSPPVFGWAAAMLVPEARRAVIANLRRVRGPVSPVRETREMFETFGTYASCLAEVLSNDGGPRAPHATVYGERFFRAALEQGRGVVIVTAHTGGWDAAGPLLARDFDIQVMMVMEPERDAAARDLHDDVRKRSGLKITHVGDDPLASLPLMHHLRAGGVVALQLDRFVPGMRTRRVPLLGGMGEVPEGPLRLAQMTGAPLVPVFCARTGYRDYLLRAFEPTTIPRRADDATLDAAAARVANAMTLFLRAYPTQWLKFTVDKPVGAV